MDAGRVTQRIAELDGMIPLARAGVAEWERERAEALTRAGALESGRVRRPRELEQTRERARVAFVRAEELRGILADALRERGRLRTLLRAGAGPRRMGVFVRVGAP